MDERELARRCAEGDETAMETLYRAYSGRLLSLCRRYAPEALEAEDLMQDAFIKIFRVISRYRYDGPGSLYSWMARVTINLCFDSARRRRWIRTSLSDESLRLPAAEEPAYEQVTSIPQEDLRAMVEELPESYRTVFQLYCIDGLSHAEIGRLLGIREKSSSSILRRARILLSAKIKAYLKDHGNE